MEPRGCNRWQPVANHLDPEAPKQGKTVAAGCDRLPQAAHGKGRVDPTSLLLKRGSPSWLRKERTSPANPKARRTQQTLTVSAPTARDSLEI
jgi:hypothetical protein